MSNEVGGGHEFFERIKERNQLANFRAMRGATRNKFSYYFRIMFHELGQVKSKNLQSWLEVFASHFRINMNYVKPFMLEEARNLFRELQVDPTDPRNTHVFQFWLYLNKIYISLFYQNYSGRDNILGFTLGFPIHATKVVIIGQDPTRRMDSSGFAFHLSPCVSTGMLLSFLTDEMTLVSRLSGGTVPPLFVEQYDKAKQTGDLSGWINQGVLLINSNLTCAKANWNVLVNFLVRYLSRNIENLVFILAGNTAMEKARFIDHKRHVVVRVYHPAVYSYKKRHARNQNGRDWDRVLPFLNANLFLLQKTQLNPNCLIDWHQINGKKINNDRMQQLHSFYVKLIEDPRTQILEPGNRYVLTQYTVGKPGGWMDSIEIRVVRGRKGTIYLESIKLTQ